MPVANQHPANEDTVRRAFTGVTNIMRTLACTLVVIVHINIYIRPAMENWWPGGFIGAPIYGTAVPVFFLISGFSAGRYARGVHRPGLLTFFRRKLKVLIIPFLVWNGILIALLGITGGLPSTVAIIYQLFTGAWQLYYVFALLQMLVVNFYLGRYFEGKILTYTLIGSFFVSFFFYAAADLSLWIIGDGCTIFERDLNRLLFPWIFFFMLGVWLRQSPGRIEWLLRRAYWLAALSVLFWIFYSRELVLEEQWIGYNPLKQFLVAGFAYQIFTPLLMFVSLYWLEKTKSLRGLFHMLSSAGRDTYAIYLCHTTVLMVVFSLWGRYASFVPYYIEVPLLAACVWVLCRILIRIVFRFRLRLTGLALFGLIINTRRTHQ